MADQGDADAIAELEAMPALPEHGEHLWAWFMSLHETRQSNGISIGRLTRLEIRLWEEDEGLVLEPWERRTIMAIDAAWVRSVNEDLSKGAKS